jgi:hypothetical protein
MPRDELLESHNKSDVILDARVGSDSVVYFNYGPVRFDSSSRTVTSRSRLGMPFELKYQEISAFRVERRDDKATALLILGLGGAAVLLIVGMRNAVSIEGAFDDVEWH